MSEGKRPIDGFDEEPFHDSDLTPSEMDEAAYPETDDIDEMVDDIVGDD